MLRQEMDTHAHSHTGTRNAEVVHTNSATHHRNVERKIRAQLREELLAKCCHVVCSSPHNVISGAHIHQALTTGTSHQQA
jgi:hypothetical protein